MTTHDEWNLEWLRIIRKSNVLAKSSLSLFSDWFYPVYNFLFTSIHPIFEKNINFLSLAPVDFVVQSIQWLSIPIIRSVNIFNSSLSPTTLSEKMEKIIFSKKLLIVIVFHNLFLYGSIDPDIFYKIGDDDAVLIVIASSWPIELQDMFLYINFPSLTVEKTLFLKTYIWYFLRQYHSSLGDTVVVPLYLLEKFPGIMLDKLPETIFF